MAFTEHDRKDRVIAQAPTSTISVTAAFVDLGNIVGHARRTGGYQSEPVNESGAPERALQAVRI